MSRRRPKQSNLQLLHSLVQDTGEESTPEKQALLDTLFKESGGDLFNSNMNGHREVNNNKVIEGNSKRVSRGRTKDRLPPRPSTAKKPPSGARHKNEDQAPLVSIPLAESKTWDSKSDLNRSPSSSSSSSFWSSRSRSRSHSPRSKSKSRSRSNSRSRSSSYEGRNRRRYSSGSSSRSPPPSRPSRSSSPPSARLGSKKSKDRSRSRSSSPRSSVHSVPTNFTRKKGQKKQLDTMSDQGKSSVRKGTMGRRKKLLQRTQMKKYRSLEINPDAFIEESLNQKYRELNELVQNSFSDTKPQVTRRYFDQMQNIRNQYVRVSHGLPPSGVLIPADLPTSVHNTTTPKPRRQRPRSAGYAWNSQSDLSTFSEDGTYGTIRSVMTASVAKQNLRLTDVHEKHKPKTTNKKTKNRKGSKASLEVDLAKKRSGSLETSITSKATSSQNISPRGKMPSEPTDHHIKNSNNTKLIEWLKEKDTLHRQQKKEEKRKKKEERQKIVLEANEKLERKMESNKQVQKWMREKNKDAYKKYKEEKRAKRMEETRNEYNQRSKSFIVPGTRMRPQSAPSNRADGNDKVTLPEENKQHADVPHEPHPPASKFIYKRPVAGRIKLKARPKSASVINARESSSSPVRNRGAPNVQKTRMSYDDWVSQKRKLDQEKKKQLQFQKEELAKSDPELAKIVPDIAKKRIHQVLEGKKSIDTGIKKIDDTANRSFGGSDFDGDNEKTKENTNRHSYRLEEDRVSSSREKRSDNLNVSGKGFNGRPQTAPAVSNKMPSPKVSVNSPRKAVVPAKSERSDEVSTGFSLPFPADKGVPKHVAEMQRKLFAEKVREKLEGEERPEPQGCDANEPVQCSTAPSTDNVSTGNGSSDKKDSVLNEAKSEKEELNSKPNPIDNDDDMSARAEPGELESMENLQSSQREQHHDSILKHSVNGEEKMGDEELKDGNLGDDSFNTSRSAKHVSFCEDAEIFAEEAGADEDIGGWSTDTATPDEDDYTSASAKNDLGTEEQTIDGYGQELNNASEDVFNKEDINGNKGDSRQADEEGKNADENEDTDGKPTFLTESLEEDF